MKRRALLLGLPLAACAAPPARDGVAIAPGVVLRVPPPSLLASSASVAQHVRADFPGASLGFETQIALTPQGLLLVALDAMGRRAMTIDWRGPTPAIEAAPWLPALFRPANLLADLALIYWPEALLGPALRQAGARLEMRPDGRLVLAGETEIIRVTRVGEGWQGRALFRNAAFGYSLDIASVLIEE